jgi:siderophore synthetase component
MENEKKVSQMILDVAALFIELGKSEEERQSNLDIACKAWNISILSENKRNEEYNKYLDGMKSIIKDEQIVKYLREDLDGLIQAKLELYPNEIKPIVSAKLKNIDSGQYQVTAIFGR